eukprot:2308509-Pyramimonas_sp.AAC.1
MNDNIINWDEVKNAFSRTKPAEVSQHVVGMIAHDLEGYERTLKVRREIDGKTLSLIAALDLTQCPEYINCIMKSIMAAPEVYCDRNGYCKMMTGTDLHDATHELRPSVIECCKQVQAAKD